METIQLISIGVVLLTALSIGLDISGLIWQSYKLFYALSMAARILVVLMSISVLFGVVK